MLISAHYDSNSRLTIENFIQVICSARRLLPQYTRLTQSDKQFRQSMCWDFAKLKKLEVFESTDSMDSTASDFEKQTAHYVIEKNLSGPKLSIEILMVDKHKVVVLHTMKCS